MKLKKNCKSGINTSTIAAADWSSSRKLYRDPISDWTFAPWTSATGYGEG